eukprot:TRINITY_DN15501_c0_g1_i2.p3 TRINITY_DN15501_c0_g1~~TRINITY_DN15501_c0_g1_i2.p3  ORF type:complete len:105 (+),score=8.53 TRINITY_DN15501_c0_g1_i2:102-416(+)
MLFRRVELSVFFPHIFYLEVWKTMVQRLFSLLFQNVFQHGLEKLQVRKKYIEKSMCSSQGCCLRTSVFVETKDEFQDLEAGFVLWFILIGIGCKNSFLQLLLQV